MVCDKLWGGLSCGRQARAGLGDAALPAGGAGCLRSYADPRCNAGLGRLRRVGNRGRDRGAGYRGDSGVECMPGWCVQRDGATEPYDAFGVSGTIFRALDWKRQSFAGERSR